MCVFELNLYSTRQPRSRYFSGTQYISISLVFQKPDNSTFFTLLTGHGTQIVSQKAGQLANMVQSKPVFLFANAREKGKTIYKRSVM